MADSRRQDRVGALIQRELSEIIQRSVKDPRVAFCTVTQAEVSPDLKYVDVKVSVIGDEVQKDKTLAGLKSAAGFLRREIGTDSRSGTPRNSGLLLMSPLTTSSK